MKYLLIALTILLSASCVATTQQLRELQTELRAAKADDLLTDKEVDDLSAKITSIVNEIEDEAWDWSELILAVGGAVTGTGVLTGAAVNKIRDKRRVLRNEPVGITKPAATT